MDGGAGWASDGPLAGVIATERPDGLRVITEDPTVAAAIWARRLRPSLQAWLDALPPEQLPAARVVLAAGRVPDCLGAIFDMAGTPPGPERDALGADIAALARIFADLMGARYLRVRLDVVRTDACRKFHLDAVTVRLVCTYRGTGTQYGLARGVETPDRICTAPTGAPILFCGTRATKGAPSDLRHRSPPIEGTGATRLVLVLDPVDDPDAE
jgi:hypothetical protein